MFDCIAYTKERASKRAHMDSEQLIATALKSKQANNVSKECPAEDSKSDTEELPVISKRVGQVFPVHCRNGCLGCSQVDRQDPSW